MKIYLVGAVLGITSGVGITLMRGKAPVTDVAWWFGLPLFVTLGFLLLGLLGLERDAPRTVPLFLCFSLAFAVTCLLVNAALIRRARDEQDDLSASP